MNSINYSFTENGDDLLSNFTNNKVTILMISIESIYIVSQTISIITILIGGLLQSYANETIDALIISIFLMAFGLIILKVVFKLKQEEIRAFLMSYAACIFAGGLAQCYSLAFFNNVQGTIDARMFLSMISSRPPFTTMADINTLFNSPLSIVVWQQIYKVTWFLGVNFGPYIGIMFNALVMGITGSVTVRIAREIFGNDRWRLRRVGTLFALSGLLILFGSIFLRDCFTTFFNTLALFGFVILFTKPQVKKTLAAILMIGLSICAIFYLRGSTTYLFVLYFILFLCLYWFKNAHNIFIIVQVLLILLLLIIFYPVFITYFGAANDMLTLSSKIYAENAYNSSMGVSLGSTFILNQPIVIRLIIGTGAVLINPIPLWNNFDLHFIDYLWIKGYNGIYQVLVLPLFFLGCIMSYSMLRNKQKNGYIVFFLVCYLLLNLIAVVSTSMEQRHLAQFMPAAIIIAALPNTNRLSTKHKLRLTVTIWVLFVVIVHLIWATLKGIV